MYATAKRLGKSVSRVGKKERKKKGGGGEETAIFCFKEEDNVPFSAQGTDKTAP